MAHLNRRNTIQEVMEQSASNIAASRVAKDEDRLANREIHSFGGEQQVWLAIAGGLTTAGLCRSLGISPSSFSRWIERGGQQRMLEYQASKKMQAQLIADQAIEIADNAKSDNVELDIFRVQTSKWLAAKIDPQVFGKSTGHNFAINLEVASLDSLRLRSV